MPDKTKVHTQYKLNNGTRVPSVTTVIGILAKPALIHWSWKCGLRGDDYKAIRDQAGEVGTLAHQMILADLKGEEVDTSEYAFTQVESAKHCYSAYLEWRKERGLEPILLETPLVSETLMYGGTPDYYGYLDGTLVLMDYKTGGVYQEAFIQTVAYRELLVENGYAPAEKIIILGIPRNEGEKFQEITWTNFDPCWEMFKHLRAAYELQKQIKV